MLELISPSSMMHSDHRIYADFIIRRLKKGQLKKQNRKQLRFRLFRKCRYALSHSGSLAMVLISFLFINGLLTDQFAQAKKHTSFKSSKDSCGQDLFEPNNLRSRARNLSKELKNNREITASICQGDHDWYTVWLNRGDLVEFTISSAIDKSPKLSVYAPRKRKTSGIIHRISPSMKSLKLYAKKSGRYRLHVAPSHEARSAYTLSYHKPMY